MKDYSSIQKMTQNHREQVRQNPLLNIDTFIIPSPYVNHPDLILDMDLSSVWIENGAVLGFMELYAQHEKKLYHIYKIVTSPFGRGKGIGSCFIENLALALPRDATVYLYIWEKQMDTIDFFENKGFHQSETIVYRNLVYVQLKARVDHIFFSKEDSENPKMTNREEIGRTRHDARKTLKLLSNMVDMLSIDNGERIIEDINRESTSLMNMLNSFRDSLETVHKVNLQDIILERVVPFIESSTTPCELQLTLGSRMPLVYGSFITIGRSLINLIANALESISETGRRGIIEIAIRRDGDQVILTIKDNGAGISPERMVKNEDGLPGFVGQSTKKKKGEGLGTLQIYSTFDACNINVTSQVNVGTTWTILMDKAVGSQDRWYLQMNRRFNEFKILSEAPSITKASERAEVIAAIWQMRKMEIFLFDLIMKYSKNYNIRDIFRNVLAYREDCLAYQKLEAEIDSYSTEYPVMNEWLKETIKEIRIRKQNLFNQVDIKLYKGALFKSYGQGIGNIIIFTLDPDEANFFASDRKLAEHLDFAPYLKKEKKLLLRGEYVGDISRLDKAIHLGFWTIDSHDDLIAKLKLLRKGARCLMKMGVHPDKQLSFYQTTFIHHEEDINTDMTTTFGDFAKSSDEDLYQYIKAADEEFLDFFAAPS